MPQTLYHGTVLCATDLSAEGQHALAQAAEIAQAYEAKLLVAHILAFWDPRYDVLVPDLEQKLAAQAHERLRQELAHLGHEAEAPVEIVVRHGPTVVELLKLVREHKPGLLVVGGRAAPGRGSHLGAIGEELLRRAPATVLVARPAPKPDFQKVVCAVDGSPCGAAGLTWAVDLATRDKIPEVVVVNAFSIPTGYLEAGLTYEAIRARVLDVHRQDLEKSLTAFRGGPVALRAVIEEGPPAQTVMRVAEQEGADLLVLGTHGRSPIVSFFLGSVALRVARQATHSVLLVRSSEHRVGLLSALDGL